MEELVWRIRRLPAREPIGPTAAGCLPGMDSRACAALLKELARTGLAHRAQEFFDYVLALGDASEAARLADVYTYTAAISICVSAQQVPFLSSLSPSRLHFLQGVSAGGCHPSRGRTLRQAEDSESVQCHDFLAKTGTGAAICNLLKCDIFCRYVV